MSETAILFNTIDCGVNFASTKKYPRDRLNKIMSDAKTAGVTHVVCIGNTIKESRENITLSQRYDNLYYTVGIHPHHASSFVDKDIEFLEEAIIGPKCVFIGECGLDYNRMFSPKDTQIEVFCKQIELAKTHNMKLYLHCRDAFDDFIECLKKYEYYNGLVHCFTGTKEQAIVLTELGFKIGITGWLLDKRRNHDLVDAVNSELITLDMLVVETDAPWMPIKRKKNQLLMIHFTLLKRLLD